MLQYTHQPSPSLRHRLASRLESSLQNMHTPRPAPEPEPMLDVSNGTSDNWAIFDQRSMELASQNLGLESGIGLGGGMAVGGGVSNPNGEAMGDSSLQGGYDGGVVGVGVGGQAVVGDGYGEVWMGGAEQYSDAWQNTLFRLFGNADLDVPRGNGLE